MPVHLRVRQYGPGGLTTNKQAEGSTSSAGSVVLSVARATSSYALRGQAVNRAPGGRPGSPRSSGSLTEADRCPDTSYTF